MDNRDQLKTTTMNKPHISERLLYVVTGIVAVMAVFVLTLQIIGVFNWKLACKIGSAIGETLTKIF